MINYRSFSSITCLTRNEFTYARTSVIIWSTNRTTQQFVGKGFPFKVVEIEVISTTAMLPETKVRSTFIITPPLEPCPSVQTYSSKNPLCFCTLRLAGAYSPMYIISHIIKGTASVSSRKILKQPIDVFNCEKHKFGYGTPTYHLRFLYRLPHQELLFRVLGVHLSFDMIVKFLIW